MLHASCTKLAGVGICFLALGTSCATPPTRAPAPPAGASETRGTHADAVTTQWPPLAPLGRNDYDLRLREALLRCGQVDVARLDGAWTASGPGEFASIAEVWICEGHIRWRNQIGLVNDICMSQVTEVPDGFNGEGVWHEDWHDPGDASGLYVRIRESSGTLFVEASPWDDDPGKLSPFFTLRRSGSTNGRYACPIE